MSVQANGKKRLILDLRVVNLHLWKEKVKFEDLRTALMFVKENCWMFKFDIHSAYHHVDIFPDHTKYLGFSWASNGVRSYFRFLVLPFGIRTAPYVFTKLTRPLIAKWRGQGFHILMYMDDGLGCNVDKSKASEQANRVKSDLLLSGFVPKSDKSLWSPTQELIFLGVLINTGENVLSIPPYRVEKTVLFERYFEGNPVGEEGSCEKNSQVCWACYFNVYRHR